jgi:AAA family ATP:ADP antiporter
MIPRVVDVRRSELSALVLSAAFFFCILTSNYILRPVRDQLALVGGRLDIAHNFTGTLILTVIATPVFAWLVTRYSRQRFIPMMLRFIVSNLIVFWALMRFGPKDWEKWLNQVFFAWVSMSNLFAVGVFWSLMADLFSLEQGKRLFGPIAVGGSLGAIAGSSFVTLFAEALGPPQLLLVSGVLLEGGVWLMHALLRATRQSEEERVASAAPARATRELEQEGGILNGIALVFSSGYLAWICGYMLLGSAAGTVLYFEQAAVLKDAVTNAAERTAFLGRIDLAVNVAALLTQLFLTARIVKWIGIGPTLAIQCILFGIGLLAVGSSPALAVVVGANILFRIGHYATSRPSREALFTVVGREAKYKSKGFIDTFVYRLGDFAGAWLNIGLGSLGGLGVQGIALASLPIAVAWGSIGFLLGRKQKRLVGEQVKAAPLPATPVSG